MASEWYQKGLPFKCTGCGKCCTGSPGYVWVNEEEMQEISGFLKLEISDFKKRYTRKIGHRFSLVEFKKNYDCVFLKDGKCQIYQVRPTQCKTFPFWPQHLLSPETWNAVAKNCEGISKDAELISSTCIDEQKLIQLTRNSKPL